MAWTTPGTVTAGQVYTAARYNTDTVGNLEYLKTETDTLTAGRGPVFIKEQSFSAVSTQTVSSCFSSTYRAYELVFTQLRGTNANALRLQLRAGSTTETGNVYISQEIAASSTTVTGGRSVATSSAFIATHAPSLDTACVVRILNPGHAVTTSAITMTQYQFNTSVELYVIANSVNTTTAYDSFVLNAGAGTITGTVRVYGWAGS